MSNKSKIYTIATAQLDTVWNWDFEFSVKHNLKKTLHDNFKLFETYPEYRFNFGGSYRYELFNEYYPEEFEQLKNYVAQGKWNIIGSTYENSNINLISPETMFRNILYAKNYFANEFGKITNELYCPNKNPYPWTVATIAANSNLKGFTAPKLDYKSTTGVPFNIGFIKGPDGKQVYANLDSLFFDEKLKQLRKSSVIKSKIKENYDSFGMNSAVHFYGCDNSGGAPKESDIKLLSKEISQNNQSDSIILSSTPSELFDDLSELDPVSKVRIPIFVDELTSKNHGVGSYTSRAFSKRISKKNEELADMAERSSVIASNVCCAPYPQDELETAWKRVIAHSASNDISGTAVQRAYQRSWNDYIKSANQFSSIYEGSSAKIIKNMDTSWTKGLAVVVGNMVEQERISVADVTIPSAGFTNVRVFNADGKEVPSQVNFVNESIMKVSILTSVPALGYKVYDLLYTYEACKIDTGLFIGDSRLQNFKYLVSINKKGDISSIVDKTLNDTEILKKPIRFEINKYDGNKNAPAWSLNYKEIDKLPWEFAENADITVVEKGPVRVTYKVVQKAGYSTYTRYISLVSGCSWVNVYNEIEWREFRSILHNGFYFNHKNSYTTCDLGLGNVKREKATKNLYSSAAQKWVDLSDPDKKYGVSIFSDSKAGWIMSNNNSLRMTVLHSPKSHYRADSVQGMLDFGLNRYGYAIYSHKNELNENTNLNAKFFCQPLTTFITNSHYGTLGSKYQFGIISNKNVAIRAIKKAEKTDEIILRVNEVSGNIIKNAEIFLGLGITSANEVFATEEYKDVARVSDSKLIFDLEPFEVKTFAITLTPCAVSAKKSATPVDLPMNIPAVTKNTEKVTGSIPSIECSIPAEIFPENVICNGIDFKFAKESDEFQALLCNGQEIPLTSNKFYFIGASLYGDKNYEFLINHENVVNVKVQSINEKIGAWDLYDLGEVAKIKTDKLAWSTTHTHSYSQDNVGDELYFFMYEISTIGASSLTLPSDSGLIILAASESDDIDMVDMNSLLYDRVYNRTFNYKMPRKQKRKNNKQKRKALPAYQEKIN